MPTARGIGRHGRGSVARGGAGYPAETILPGERGGHRHAGIFERSGGIHALVFGVKMLHSGNASTGRDLIERGISFAQSDGRMALSQGRQNFAKAPDAALIDIQSGRSAVDAKEP